MGDDLDDLNSFVWNLPFFASKQFSFANLSWTPCSSFAEPMLSKAYWATPFRNVCWLSPAPSQNFRGKLFPQTPAISRGRIEQGPWCLALAKPCFWKLGCCISALFLETSEMDTSVTPKSKLSKSFMEQCNDHIPCKIHCAVHLCSVLVVIIGDSWWFIISNFRETFTNKTYLSRTQKTTFAGSDVGTLEAFAIKDPYMDL